MNEIIGFYKIFHNISCITEKKKGVQTECRQTKCRTDKMLNRQNVEQTKCRTEKMSTDKMSNRQNVDKNFFLKKKIIKKIIKLLRFSVATFFRS